MLPDEVAGLEARVREFAQDGVPALEGERALLAVSGGGDSIATAALLCEAGIVDPAQSVVGHFDHGLRGKVAAAADRAVVEAMCARYGFELVYGSWEVPRWGEAAAREARYAFLREMAVRAGISVIVTGHTSDDQAETVLMHAMRGAGLHGLGGMRSQSAMSSEKRDVGGEISLARPMLCVSRAETRAYCAARGLEFVDDETNADATLLRNRVRLEVLPRIEAAAPGARVALLRLADESREAASAMDALVAPAITRVGQREIELSREALRALPREALPFTYRLAITRLVGDARDIERKHYGLMPDPVSARTGAVYELPRGLVLTVDRDVFLLSVGVPEAEAIPAAFAAPLPFAGVVGGWCVRVVRGDGEGGLAVPAGGVVRGRRAGDRMRLRGGSRKLQDVFVDLRVPRRVRDGVPVIAVGGDVLWTPFAEAVEGDAAYNGERFNVVAERR